MTIASDLLSLNNIKQALKTLLLGRSIISGADTFSDYASKIQNTLTVGALKTCNIAYNYQSSTITAVNLPNAEPASSQISYTVTSGMFPSLTGDLPASIDYVGFLLAGCINNNGSSARTLNWRVKRNGVSIGTGSQSVAASNRGTLNFSSLRDTNKPTVNDVLEVYLWCTESASDMQINRKGLGVVPTRFKPVNNASKLIKDVAIAWENYQAISNFTVSYGSLQGMVLPYNANYATQILQFGGASTISFPLFSEHSTYGLFTSPIDSNGSNAVLVNASNYNYNVAGRPSSISWKETNIINGVNLL